MKERKKSKNIYCVLFFEVIKFV